MSSADEQINLEGGESNQILAQANHEGGISASENSPVLYTVPEETSSASHAVRLISHEGAESALRIDASGATSANVVSLPSAGNVALKSFNFPSPAFQHPTNPGKVSEALKENVPSSNQPPAPLRALPPGFSSASTASASAKETIPFSKMSASDLGQVVAGSIHGFKTDLWIAEDISGSAILGHLAPSALSNFLEQDLNIKSGLTRKRIQAILAHLIEKDSSMNSNVRESWVQFQVLQCQQDSESSANGQRATATPTSAFVPQSLFSTPHVGGAVRPRASSLPAIFSGRQSFKLAPVNDSPAPFLKECGSPDDFSLEDSSLFANTTRAAVTSGATNIGGQAFGSNGINITINQPSATPPKYIILNCASDSVEFYNWIRKNRKETLLALPVDRRNLSQLVSEEVKDEVARILKHLGPSNKFYFSGESCPYPSSWSEVTDHLLLKILFSINGPRSAADAKIRLKSRLFFFNDSTTPQDKFTTKLRKYCNEFKGTLKDFAYTYHMWEENDELEHTMIVEAFSDCFHNVEQIKGPDGISMVPKSRNYAKVREMIRERKSLPLEDIINHIVDAFERIDIAVRSNRAVTYDVKPWKVDESKKKKRNFNQISGGQAEKQQNKKPPRPPAEHPRCANCGRKSHLCGERTCYLFGHPKGRGANGEWAAGEPSLFIEKDEMKVWKVTRDPIYYGYPENQRHKRAGA